MSAHDLELLLARVGSTSGERRALARDAERGLLVRVRPGVYADRTAWDAASPEERHVIAMRALAAAVPRPPVFSHWSAAVLHGLPTLREHLDRVHVASQTPNERDRVGVAAHLVPLETVETARVGQLLVTTPIRTVVDVALGASFADGVVLVDGALRSGADRRVLQEAVMAAAERRGAARAQAVVGFARAEAESAAESRSRVTMLRLGLRPPVLQFEVRDRLGLAGRLDFWFPEQRVGGEVDGEKKYLDLGLAKRGAAHAVVQEKRREDRLRRRIDGLARWGWVEAGGTALLGPILAAAGVVPPAPRATLADYSTSLEARV